MIVVKPTILINFANNQKDNNMQLKSTILAIAILLSGTSVLMASCTMTARATATPASSEETTAPIFPELKLPSIPETIKVPQQRAAYILLHFWDNMDWNNKDLISNDNFMEQNLSTYFDLFNHVATEDISPAVVRLIEQASVSPDAIEKIGAIADLYLYDTQSPIMNESYYRIIVERLLDSNKISDYRATILQAALDDMSKNAPGTVATSFPFTLRNGSTTELKKEINRSGRTILLFYDPDCDDCAMVESLMQSNAKINSSIADGSLKVVAVCPYTVETDDWATHASTLPSTWTVGYSPDGEVDGDGIYVLRATPTIFLLDPDGKVLAKDIRYEILREIL